MVSHGALVALNGCGQSPAAPDAQTIDAVNRCAAFPANATLSSSAVLGPTNDPTSTLSFSPTQAGDTIVLAIVVANGTVEPSVPNGGVGNIAAQVGTTPKCDRYGVILSLGNIEAGVDSITLTGTNEVGSTVHPTYVAYATVFSGLRPAAGATLQPYETSIGFGDTAAARAPACPGSAVVSLLVSCGVDPTMATESPFISIDTRDSTSSAYFVPQTNGNFSAEWSLPGGANWGVASASFQ